MTEPVKTCTCCSAEKPLALFPKHRRMKDGRASVCSECNKAKCREKYQANKERYKKVAAEWKAANRERYNEATRVSAAARRKADPERHAVYAKTYRERNRAELLVRWREDQRSRRAQDPERHRRMSKEWAARNRPKVAVVEARRRAVKRNRVTCWDGELDALVVAEAFDLRARRLAATSVDWHVDHIVPLQGKTVSGLHNAYNLAVIPAAANVRKKNLYWPGMP